MYYSLATAKTKFHKQLLNCLAACFDEVPEIQQDKQRQVKLKKSGSCC